MVQSNLTWNGIGEINTKYEEAIAKVRQSSFVAKPGQRCQPPDDQVDEYLAKNDEICNSVPHDIEEFSVMQLFKGLV